MVSKLVLVLLAYFPFYCQPTRVCLCELRVIAKPNVNICTYTYTGIWVKNCALPKITFSSKEMSLTATGSEWQTSNAERSALTSATMYSFNLALTAARVKHRCLATVYTFTSTTHTHTRTHIRAHTSNAAYQYFNSFLTFFVEIAVILRQIFPMKLLISTNYKQRQ